MNCPKDKATYMFTLFISLNQINKIYCLISKISKYYDN